MNQGIAWLFPLEHLFAFRINNVDFSADDFDPDVVMLPLEDALVRLTVPAITMDI